MPTQTDTLGSFDAADTLAAGDTAASGGTVVDPGCCPKVWFCVGGVPTEWPVGAPPDGFTAGPFATRKQAEKACPFAVCDCKIVLPRLPVFNFTNRTGLFAEIMANSVTAAAGWNDESHYYTAPTAAGEFILFDLRANYVCVDGGVELQVDVVIGNASDTGPGDRAHCFIHGGGAPTAVVPYTGWTTGGAAVFRTFPCGSSPLAAPQPVGRWTFPCFLGTPASFDVTLST